MNQAVYRVLISGQDKRFCAALLRSFLAGASLPYSAGVRMRNTLYSAGLMSVHKVPVPVISVGNITTGGTGKTPIVIWLCRYLCSKGFRCAILTRGYKTEGEISDEPALLAKNCPGVEVVINPDRLAGAKKAIEQCGAEVLVLDDGFQHRRIYRDVNIVAIDATCPFGYEKLLPAGLLREPIDELKRADAVIITRFDLAEPETLNAIETRIRQRMPAIDIARASHRICQAVLSSGRFMPLSEIKHKKVFVFCGIGNPQAFVNCLNQQGIRTVGSRFFNDHHIYTRDDILSMAQEAVSLGAEYAFCTQKDWIKAAVFCKQIEILSFGFIAMELDFAAHADTITALVDKAIQQKYPERKYHHEQS